MFGPPGAGKGTHAAPMVKKYNLKHISTGELLRSEIAAGTELGKQAAALIEKGNLVPDEVVEARKSSPRAITAAFRLFGLLPIRVRLRQTTRPRSSTRPALFSTTRS